MRRRQFIVVQVGDCWDVHVHGYYMIWPDEAGTYVLAQSPAIRSREERQKAADVTL